MLQTVWAFLAPMKWSWVAWLVGTALGFFGMGALGYALYYVAWPVLGRFHGAPGEWSGDWVWPATIMAGMLWPLSFLAAGGVQLYVESLGWSRWASVATYAVILWLGAVLAWWLVLFTRPAS